MSVNRRRSLAAMGAVFAGALMPREAEAGIFHHRKRAVCPPPRPLHYHCCPDGGIVGPGLEYNERIGGIGVNLPDPLLFELSPPMPYRFTIYAASGSCFSVNNFVEIYERDEANVGWSFEPPRVFCDGSRLEIYAKPLHRPSTPTCVRSKGLYVTVKSSHPGGAVHQSSFPNYSSILYRI